MFINKNFEKKIEQYAALSIEIKNKAPRNAEGKLPPIFQRVIDFLDEKCAQFYGKTKTEYQKDMFSN